MLTVTSGINLSPTAVAQSGRYYSAAGEVASGSGTFPAGAMLALNSNYDYVPLDPDATDGTEIPRGIALDSFDARSDSQEIEVGYWGTYTYDKVFIPKSKQFTGDGTTTTFSVGEAIKEGTVTVYVDGAVQAEGKHYSVNYDGGVIVFTEAPASGAVVDIYYGVKVPFSIVREAQRSGLWLIRVIG